MGRGSNDFRSKISVLNDTSKPSRDALLQKAENSSDLFKLSKQSETSQPSRSDAESSGRLLRRCSKLLSLCVPVRTAEPRIAVQPCALENSAAHGTGLVATDTVPDEQVGSTRIIQ